MNKTTKKAPTRAASVRKSGKAGNSKRKPTAAAGSELPTVAVAGKTPNKQQQLAALVVRDQGATLEQMIADTGWLPHTTRAALTGLKKKGYVILSDKVGGVRTYRGVAPE